MSVQTKAIKAVKKAAKSKTPSSKTPAKKKLAKPTEPQAANTGATADASVVRVHKYSEVELKALPQTHCLSLIAKRWRREQRKLAKQNGTKLPKNLFSLSTLHARKTLDIDAK